MPTTPARSQTIPSSIADGLGERASVELVAQGNARSDDASAPKGGSKWEFGRAKTFPGDDCEREREGGGGGEDASGGVVGNGDGLGLGGQAPLNGSGDGGGSRPREESTPRKRSLTSPAAACCSDLGDLVLPKLDLVRSEMAAMAAAGPAAPSRAKPIEEQGSEGSLTKGSQGAGTEGSFQPSCGDGSPPLGAEGSLAFHVGRSDNRGRRDSPSSGRWGDRKKSVEGRTGRWGPMSPRGAASDQYTLKLVLWSAMNVCETGYVADVHVKMYVRYEGSVINKVLRSSIVSLSSSLGAANSSDPEFNEPFVLDVPSLDASLVLAIYDTDYMRDDDMLGAIVVPTSSLLPPEAHPDKDGLVNVDFVLQPSETQKKRTEVASYFTVHEAERIRLRVSCCMHLRAVHTGRRGAAGTRRRLPSVKQSSRGAALWANSSAKLKLGDSAGKKRPSPALSRWGHVLRDVGAIPSPQHSPQRIGGAAPAATGAPAGASPLGDTAQARRPLSTRVLVHAFSSFSHPMATSWQGPLATTTSKERGATTEEDSPGRCLYASLPHGRLRAEAACVWQVPRRPERGGRSRRRKGGRRWRCWC